VAKHKNADAGLQTRELKPLFPKEGWGRLGKAQLKLRNYEDYENVEAGLPPANACSVANPPANA